MFLENIVDFSFTAFGKGKACVFKDSQEKSGIVRKLLLRLEESQGKGKKCCDSCK